MVTTGSESRPSSSQEEDSKEATGNSTTSDVIDTRSEDIQCELEELPPLQKLEHVSSVPKAIESVRVDKPAAQKAQKVFYIKAIQCVRWCIVRHSRYAQRKRK